MGVEVLHMQMTELVKHFHRREVKHGAPKDFLAARREQEQDETFLKATRDEMDVLLAAHKGRQIANIRTILDDQIDLNKTKCDMRTDHYLRDDTDFSSFFNGQKQPE